VRTGVSLSRAHTKFCATVRGHPIHDAHSCRCNLCTLMIWFDDRESSINRKSVGLSFHGCHSHQSPVVHVHDNDDVLRTFCAFEGDFLIVEVRTCIATCSANADGRVPPLDGTDQLRNVVPGRDLVLIPGKAVVPILGALEE